MKQKTNCKNCNVLAELMEKQLMVIRVQSMTLKEFKAEKERIKKM